MSVVFGLLFVLILLFGFVVFFGAPYVPSLNKEVKAAFKELYPVSSTDTVVDLGSGDGAVLKIAQQYGAKTFGFELNPILTMISRFRLGKNATIENKNMWNAVLPMETTLVYAFAVTRDVRKLGRYIQTQSDRLGRPVLVMTFGAELPDYTPIKTRKAHNLYEITPRL